MKAIIGAAGMGTRLSKYTKDSPKGMLEFEGKSLIQRQVDTLRSAGINDISIIKGYMKEKIQIEGTKEYVNEEYTTTNMVASLMEAQEEMDDDFLFCYSDIIYEKRLLEEIEKSTADVSILCDDDWIDYWKDRLDDDWINDVESFEYDEDDNMTNLGEECGVERAKSRYIGIIKFSKKGGEELIRAWNENKEKYWDSDEKWRASKSFRQAYMTCILQELIERGVDVRAVHVSHGWMEFDTNEDYEKAQEWVKNGKIEKYISL